MNTLPIEKRVQTVDLLVECLSMRSISRVADVSINTVTKLLEDVGAACCEHQDRAMRNLQCTQLHVDEIWAFIGAKQKSVPIDADPTLGLGDCYTYTSIDPVTKLMPCWMLGYRDAEPADHFMADLKARFKVDVAGKLATRLQLTTDGMSGYPAGVAKHFGKCADYAVLNKPYSMPTPTKEASRRYSPNEVVGITKAGITKAVAIGKPDQALVSTSLVERANLTIRMGMRRFTRLTNGFSKKIENHMFAVGLHFMHYNFGRVHKTLRVTPAMQAGITKHVWSIEEIVNLIPAPEAKRRGAYKARAVKAA